MVRSRRTSDWIRWYRDIVQRGFDGATTVLAPSRWMLSQIEKYYGKRTASRASSTTAAARSGSIRMARKKTCVLTVGRLWDPAKQVSLLAKCDCGWPAIIAGETQHPDQAYRAETKRIVCEGMLELKGKQTAEQLRRCLRGRRSMRRLRVTSRSDWRW